METVEMAGRAVPAEPALLGKYLLYGILKVGRPALG